MELPSAARTPTGKEKLPPIILTVKKSRKSTSPTDQTSPRGHPFMIKRPPSPKCRWPISRLIIVCCHAICVRGATNGIDPSEWLIEDFQDPKETATFIEHIKEGLRLLSKNNNSLLIFSGGPTKQDRSALSEAESYLDVAQANNFFNFPVTEPKVRSHIGTEELAVDSYQNLLFSITRYYNTLGRWPQHVTLVSHDFKKRRFVELHCPAIWWPREKFTFVGINPPENVVSRLDLELGEENKGYGSFKKDPYGAHTYLRDKREDRGWSTGQLLKVCYTGLPTEVKKLLWWRGGRTGNEYFRESLPWSPRNPAEGENQARGAIETTQGESRNSCG